MQAAINESSKESLGWSLDSFKAKNAKILEKGQGFCIAQAPSNKKKYCLDSFPRLSCQESRLLCKCTIRQGQYLAK